MSEDTQVPNVDSVAAQILEDQRSNAQKEAARAKATIALNARAAAADPVIKEEKKLRLFRCTMPSSQFVTRAGKYIPFPDGMFITDNSDDIAELEYEIGRGHPHISFDPQNKYVESAMSPSKLAERARLKEELKAEVMRDMGFTVQGNPQAGIKTSADVAMLSGESGGVVNAKLLQTLNALPKATGK